MLPIKDKCERYYLHSYNTFEKLQKDIDAYIHFYNNERLQAKLKSQKIQDKGRVIRIK
ncbi:IS3 family transposase [Paenibacillus luteus]|uniref:IS3 family transposase n=1 Tax=Paenibacillus luteus TaxID=2545753 RepID=UPI001142FDFE